MSEECKRATLSAVIARHRVGAARRPMTGSGGRSGIPRVSRAEKPWRSGYSAFAEYDGHCEQRLVRRSSQSEGGRRKRYPSIAFCVMGIAEFIIGRAMTLANIVARMERHPGYNRLICPSGGLLTGLSSLISDFPKNISVPTPPKSDLELYASRPTEGRIRIVRDAGWDAVDAAAFCARRGCRAGWRKACERSPSERTRDVAAYGEVVWS